MAEQDQQRVDWERFVRAQHDKGICEFSGLAATSCVRSICDCFETEENAKAMRRGEHSCSICRPEEEGRNAADGLGVIWECDACHRVVETGLDDEPDGWLVEEFDEDDYPEPMEIPDDLILCSACYGPDNIFGGYDDRR